MVQSGLLVPVLHGSRMAVFEEIVVDIGDGQSIEHALSTFSAHIRNMISILETTGNSTLILIDEMASGTDPGEGVGLSIALLEEFHRRRATVVATTHFSEIKHFAENTPGFQNARMEFDTETLQPLYRLRIGESRRKLRICNCPEAGHVDTYYRAFRYHFCGQSISKYTGIVCYSPLC